MDGTDEACASTIGTQVAPPWVDTGEASFTSTPHTYGSDADASALASVPAVSTAVNSDHQISRRMRLMADSAAIGESAMAPGSCAVRHAGQDVAQVAAPSEPANACRAAALNARFTKMFLEAEDGPVASGCGPETAAGTLGFVLALDPAVRSFWTAHATEIKRAMTRSRQRMERGGSLALWPVRRRRSEGLSAERQKQPRRTRRSHPASQMLSEMAMQ